jgi:HD-GYP domain-containing protein (c-di-GMP phosphodiesterase class II)
MTTVHATTVPHASESGLALDALMEQISQDFEELTWLRNLTQRIEHCDVSCETARVAEELLPQLRELIGAETLLLIEAEPSVSDISSAALRVAHCSGRCRHAAEVAHAAVTEFAERAGSGPVVINGDCGTGELFTSRRVRSLILLSLTRQSRCFGWLLAVNREPSRSSIDRSGQLLPGLNEFGTVEVGMLQSAAVLLTTHAHNAALFREKEELLVGTIKSLVQTLEARDSYTRGHSDRVAAIARLIARASGYSNEQAERLHLTGLLHDIGKIGVPDQVLKKPGRLDDEEREAIQQHPEIGYEILRSIPSLEDVLPGVLHHHECLDGSGYPLGLVGDEIPLDARILAVADAFDAMTSDRPYRAGMSVSRAIKILTSGAGQQWDSDSVAVFVSQIEAVCAACGLSAELPEHG